MRWGHAMRAFLATMAGVALMLIVEPAAGGDPGVHDGSGVKGRVFDTTCPGPCSINEKPRPFEGDADVIANPVGERKPVAVTEVKQGHFRLPLRPGAYRVRVEPYPGSERPSCWQGSSRRVLVEPGQYTRIRLTVQNVCVV